MVAGSADHSRLVHKDICYTMLYIYIYISDSSGMPFRVVSLVGGSGCFLLCGDQKPDKMKKIGTIKRRERCGWHWRPPSVRGAWPPELLSVPKFSRFNFHNSVP